MTVSLPTPEDLPGERREVLEWFVRRQGEAWGEDDEARFQAWLASDPRHRELFSQWSANWRALDGIPSDVVEGLRRNLQREKHRQAAEARAASRRAFLRPWFASATMAGICGAVGWTAWGHWQAQPVFSQAFSTRQGQQVQVSLPDGSALWLDAATRLQVRFYRGRRDVALLDGQAVFDVSPNAARPLRVLAGPTVVTVVGTRFSVRHTPGVPGEEGVRVAVEQGRVQVAPLGDAGGERESQAVFLGAGQQVEVSAQGQMFPVARVPSEGIAAWREHRISFVDATLAQALAEFERYRPTGLKVSDPAVAQLRLTGTFDPRDVQTLRRVLPMALSVRLQAGDGGTEILSAR